MPVTSPASPPPKPSSAPPSTVTTVLDVEGMMCAGCVSTVEKKLSQCEGVVSATVNLVTEVAAVTCTPSTAPEALAQTLTEAGYPSRVRTSPTEGEALTAETQWLARKEAAQKQQAAQLVIASALLAFSVIGHLQHLSWAAHWLNSWQVPIVGSLWFHGLLATLTLLFPARTILREGALGAWRGTPNMNTLVSLGALSAYGASLVALLVPSLGWECFFDEPVMLLSFILLGRTLEERARFQAASSLRSLIALQPSLARLVPDPTQGQNQNNDKPAGPEAQGIEMGVEIPANQVQVGEWLRVLPGEKVPADGKIALGQTTLNEAMLTGESLPVVKQVGDEVIAGSLNYSGAITIQVLRTGKETTLAQLIHLVETAQTRKAPIQRLADQVSGYFTYGVLTCALLTFAFWYWLGLSWWPEATQAALGSGHPMGHMGHHATGHGMGAMTSPEMTPSKVLVSLKLAISVVVIACPCALGLATPTAILVGSGIGAARGLLIRGGDILEATQQLDTLVFDKTGTLTTGHPQVSDCIPLGDFCQEPDRLLQIAATLESGTRHPLGRAILQAATARKLTPLAAEDFYTESGYGIAANLTLLDPVAEQAAKPALYPAERYFLGNLYWMHANQCFVDSASEALANKLADGGKSVVYLAKGPRLIGLVGVTDTLRPEAANTVAQLQSMGLTIRLLSGDSPAAVEAIAQKVGLSPEQANAQVTPQGKVDAIAALQQAGHTVALVGDGLNDAPALAQAEVGIALNSGTDLATETADIVLMKDNLSDVVAALELSRATFNKIRQNLIWAFGYNLVCIPLAAGALLPSWGLSLNPGLAGGLMALSSITVVVNSLLLQISPSLRPAQSIADQSVADQSEANQSVTARADAGSNAMG